MNDNTKKIISSVTFVFFLIAVYFFFQQQNNKYSSIKTFEDCVKAGFKVLETYPEQCKMPGKLFVNQEQKNSPPIDPGVIKTGYEDKIIVENIVENQAIESPIEIIGKARGPWYFEASFPVEILDGNGVQLAIKPAEAKDEWMTVEFVPFSTTIVFTKPKTATGTIILHKDNPSGDKKFDDFLSIPIRFK